MASFKRPFGVGLLVIGFDQDGPHLFETCPSANFYEYYVKYKDIYLIIYICRLIQLDLVHNRLEHT